MDAPFRVAIFETTLLDLRSRCYALLHISDKAHIYVLRLIAYHISDDA